MASEDEKDSDSKKQETDNDDEEGKLRWPDDEVWSDDEDLEETEDSEEANDVDVVEDPDLDDADEEDELSEAEVAAINEEAQNEGLRLITHSIHLQPTGTSMRGAREHTMRTRARTLRWEPASLARVL